MIHAFRRHLKALAADPRDPFARHIRGLAGTRRAAQFEAPLRDMILRIPDMILHMRRCAALAPDARRIRRMQSLVLAYLYNPDDVLPDDRDGLFGYIDDAYLTARVYEYALEEAAVLGNPWDETPVTAVEAARWIALARELLPGPTGRIDAMLANFNSESERLLASPVA